MNVDLKLLSVLDYVDRKAEDYEELARGPQGPKGDPGPPGKDGKDGKDGRDGKDGVGIDGKDGQDGEKGEDGVSVVDARIEFDGSLTIVLSSGEEINAGDVTLLNRAEETHFHISQGGGGGLNGGQLTNNIDLGTKGFTRSFEAGDDLVLGDLCYYSTSGNMQKVDANSQDATAPLVGVATGTIANGEDGTFFINGFFPLSGFNTGDILYIGENPGEFTNSRPVTNGAFVRVMGYAVSSDEIFFNPDTTWVGLES